MKTAGDLPLSISIIVAALILVVGFWLIEERKAVNICKNTVLQLGNFANQFLHDGKFNNRNELKRNCRKLHSFFKERE